MVPSCTEVKRESRSRKEDESGKDETLFSGCDGWHALTTRVTGLPRSRSGTPRRGPFSSFRNSAPIRLSATQKTHVESQIEP